jgi:hypothetical protein
VIRARVPSRSHAGITQTGPAGQEANELILDTGLINPEITQLLMVPIKMILIEVLINPRPGIAIVRA